MTDAIGSTIDAVEHTGPAVGWVRPTRSRTDHRAARRTSKTSACGARIDAGALWLSRPSRICAACSEIVRKEALSEYIDGLLDVMRRPIQLQAGSPWGPIRHQHFDGATPWLNEWIELAGGDEGLIYSQYLPTAVRWPIDVRMISVDLDRVGEIALARFRSLDARDVRGRVRPALPYPVSVAFWTTADAKTDITVLGHAAPGRWTNIDATRKATPEKDAHWSAQVQLALGVSVFQRTRWRVYLSSGGIGITFPTDPIGVREVFRLRDIPDGRERRAALRHWVSEHWRLNPQDASEEVKVREHLRGGTEFSWSGLRCRITPSDDDLAREYAAFVARVAARSEGTDRRTADLEGLT